jgi:excisionase family DNA binding protein
MLAKKEITPLELARQRGCTLNWIYTLLKLGRIPAIRRGRRWIIPAAALNEETLSQK